MECCCDPRVSRKHTAHVSSAEALAAAGGPRRHPCATTRARRLAEPQMWPFFWVGGQLDLFLGCKGRFTAQGHRKSEDEDRVLTGV